MAKRKKNGKSASKTKRSSFFSSRVGIYCLLVALFILFIDQASKWYIDRFVPYMVHDAQWYPYHGIPVFDHFMGIEFSIVHAINRGAAWGLFSEFPQALLLFRVVFVFGLLVYLIFYNENTRSLLPFTLIASGAIGNILDHFIYGHVVDMFHFVLWGYHYPVFNVADCAICCGVVSLIILSYSNRQKTTIRSSS